MNYRPQFCLLGDAEGQGVLGMGMDDAMTSGRAAKIAA